jgi:glucose-1-phosphate cytidylyltransferase
MKVVLFCGGYGTRLREFSETIPKPLVNIGNRPIVWHLMKYYSHYGHREFILCLGYRGDLIREFFLKYNECMSNDFTLSNGGKSLEVYGNDIEDWSVTCAETGVRSSIAQRLVSVRKYLDDDDVFLANYSDGLTNLPLDDYIARFLESDAVACFVGVHPSQSLSGVKIDDGGRVLHIEYLRKSDVWINGGFFVFRKALFDYIREGEEIVDEPFQRLIEERKLMAQKHTGFWSAMDTFKDKKQFDEMYESGEMPWSVWTRSAPNSD